MNKKILVGLIIAVVIVVAASVAVAKSKHASAPSEQTSSATSQATEHNNDDNNGVNPVEPDLNTQEFRMTSTNVSCSTSTVNGSTSRNCSGNIHVVPRAQSDMEPGLYKINEQTKLLHNGVEQDLNSLQQLSQNATSVKLKLADGSADTLATITY